MIYKGYSGKANRVIETRDQFAERELKLSSCYLLGAPCLKFEWSEVP